jgi:hypothetical protein
MTARPVDKPTNDYRVPRMRKRSQQVEEGTGKVSRHCLQDEVRIGRYLQYSTDDTQAVIGDMLEKFGEAIRVAVEAIAQLGRRQTEEDSGVLQGVRPWRPYRDPRDVCPEWKRIAGIRTFTEAISRFWL